jgi:hypothetical protein
VDQYSVCPQLVECTVIGCQRRENGSLVRRHAIGCGATICEDPVLECTGVLDCGKSASGLPFYGGYPSLKDVKQCPTR